MNTSGASATIVSSRNHILLCGRSAPGAALLEWMPFAVKANQMDGGSEFEDLFGGECRMTT